LRLAKPVEDAVETLGGEAVLPHRGQSFIPLGQLADIRIVGGPPMVRDEEGCWSATSTWTSIPPK